MLNRRGFFGVLFGAAAVAAIPAPGKPVIPALSFHPVAFSFVSPTLDMAEFHARYITPAARSLAASIDERAAIFAYRNSPPPKFRAVRLDPARLPL